MVRCRVFGHRYRFWSEGNVMRWRCERYCGAGGEKSYPTARDAQRYAAGLDREDREAIGRRAPLFGLLPLRLLHAIRRRAH
ncbi:MAG TPA: hypothetical protein VIG37_23995 [Methylomirabilota bacterium]|jgi:hypothetical protein